MAPLTSELIFFNKYSPFVHVFYQMTAIVIVRDITVDDGYMHTLGARNFCAYKRFVHLSVGSYLARIQERALELCAYNRVCAISVVLISVVYCITIMRQDIESNNEPHG